MTTTLIILARYQAARYTTLPVVTDVCWYCTETVDLEHQENYTVSRINGDSKYGYEPCHKACSAAVEAEIADLDADPQHGVCDHCLVASDHVRVVQTSCVTGCDGIHFACYLCQP